MTYDFEEQIAILFNLYLGAQFDPNIAQLPPPPPNLADPNVEQKLITDCLIVTFFDPMSIEEANRIVVMCYEGQTDAADPGSGPFGLEFVIRSRWQQPSVTADFAAHFARKRELRKWMFDQNLVPNLKAAQQAFAAQNQEQSFSVTIDYVQPSRYFSNSTTEDGWMISSNRFTVQAHTNDVI